MDEILKINETINKEQLRSIYNLIIKFEIVATKK